MNLAFVYSERTRALNDVFQLYEGPCFSVRMPGWSWHSAPSSQPAFTLIIRTPEAIRVLTEDPTELSLGKSFVSGELDVEGDIFSAFGAVEYLLSRPLSLRFRLLQNLSGGCSALANQLLRGRRHSRARDASSISYHYDLPVAFYEPWLGPTLLYSTAYFRQSANGLDRAQTDKLELICRKLLLKQGERFIDIGCGWGSLAMYAASEYEVLARGITISQNQARVAARRIADAHLNGCCFVENRDYRDALKLPSRFDKAASIGMFEHVGLRGLRRYFRIVYDLLNPGGMFLNSGIVRSPASPNRRQSFIDRYVFPGGELPTLSLALEKAEKAGFEVRDVENLREHYAHTLRLWVKNLQEQRVQLLQTVSERTFRTWLLYMVGSAVAFERSDISVCQILLRRPDSSRRSALRTREEWDTDRKGPSASRAA